MSDQHAMFPAVCIERGDGLTWLREHRAEPHTSIVTSLPDVSELALGFDFSCARIMDGRVLCWSSGNIGQPRSSCAGTRWRN
mgnify:CR=1 FL=1